MIETKTYTCARCGEEFNSKKECRTHEKSCRTMMCLVLERSVFRNGSDPAWMMASIQEDAVGHHDGDL